MPTAEKILIVGGISVLVYGFLLGIPISAARMKLPHASRHLMTAHLAAIIQCGLLLGLSRAVTFSNFGSEIETVAACLLLAGVTLFDLGATANWIMRAGDHFAERTLGWRLLSVSAPLNIAGATIVLIGVIRAL